MRTALFIVASLMAIESTAVLLAPGAVRRWIVELSPNEIRAVGAVEAGIAAAILYILFAG